MMVKGQVISGEFGNIIIRQKSGQNIEIGELVISESGNTKILMQVVDLMFGSQISQQNLELISGMQLEDKTNDQFFDENLRNYYLAKLKSLMVIEGNDATVCKNMPKFFSEVRSIDEDDLSFLTKPRNPIYLGKLRSGSKVLDLDIFLEGSKVLCHHILIPAATGRGKSNLTSCMLWDLLENDYCGVLVLDPHDEYYGRNKYGLKDHPKSGKVSYYTPFNVPPGQKTLKINISLLKPNHFNGVMNLSDPQRQALHMYYKKYGKDWIESVILEKPLDVQFFAETISVIKRRLLSILDLDIVNNQLFCNGVFDLNAGESFNDNIAKELESGKIVIIDTSNFTGSLELLIGSLITTEIFNKYKRYKADGILNDKPVISIVIEEAPRVLGKEILEKGSNIFSTIAREGRKFKVGLIAITQLPSLIPREILANMNTKIILGIEMQPERQAIIDSAAQDLSDDDRAIASLDIGEALVTSNFARFAIPIKIPFLDNLVKNKGKKEYQKSFSELE